jgi:hypothetical protein
MIAFKPNVTLTGVQPRVLVAMAAFALAFSQRGYVFTVTSVMDGGHRPGSLHYSGNAFDCRSKHLPREDKFALLNEVRGTLGKDWDCLLESEGTGNEHFHLEWDPK